MRLRLIRATQIAESRRSRSPDKRSASCRDHRPDGARRILNAHSCSSVRGRTRSRLRESNPPIDALAARQTAYSRPARTLIRPAGTFSRREKGGTSSAAEECGTRMCRRRRSAAKEAGKRGPALPAPFSRKSGRSPINRNRRSEFQKVGQEPDPTKAPRRSNAAHGCAAGDEARRRKPENVDRLCRDRFR